VVSRPTDPQGPVLPDCKLTTHSPAETVSRAFIYNRAALTPRHVRWPKPTFATRNSGRADSNLRSPRPLVTIHFGPKPSVHCNALPCLTRTRDAESSRATPADVRRNARLPRPLEAFRSRLRIDSVRNTPHIASPQRRLPNLLPLTRPNAAHRGAQRPFVIMAANRMCRRSSSHVVAETITYVLCPTFRFRPKPAPFQSDCTRSSFFRNAPHSVAQSPGGRHSPEGPLRHGARHGASHRDTHCLCNHTAKPTQSNRNPTDRCAPLESSPKP